MTTWVIVVALIVVMAMGQRLLVHARRVPSQPIHGDASAVSIIVPARNESASLPTLLGSLRNLDAAPREVIVVDDGSDDDTAGIASRLGAIVVSTGGPPPGWTGKGWGCHVGAAKAGGEYLLFLDADTALDPTALRGLLHVYRRYGGLVSVQPYHRPVRPYEKLSAYFNVVPLLASGAFSGRSSRRPMAFGPCLLTSRSDYLLAGGHAVDRGAILDDVGLARAYARAGLRVRCLLGGMAVQMRMYPVGRKQFVEGWTKNISSGARHADRPTSLAAGLWLCAHWFVAMGAILCALSAVTAVPGPIVPSPVLWSAGWIAVALQLRWMLARVGLFRWWTWALFPLPLLVFGLLFAWSLVLTVGRRQVRWRGRAIRVRPQSAPGGQ